LKNITFNHLCRYATVYLLWVLNDSIQSIIRSYFEATLSSQPMIAKNILNIEMKCNGQLC